MSRPARTSPVLRKSISLAGGPALARARHAVLDAGAPAPPPVVRRARPPLTPYAVRLQILEETRDMPEETRLKSLRRRLTALDRLLSDEDAASLDRLSDAEGLLDGATNASPISRAGMGACGRSAGQPPFSEHRRYEIGARAYVLTRLLPEDRAAIMAFLAQMLPWRAESGETDAAPAAALRRAAPHVTALYRAYGRQTPRRRGE